MIKQKVRGLVYFEEKNISDVKRVFENFKFDEAKFKFFEKVKVNNQEIIMPGVFLNGLINEKYTSENVVRLFRKLMGLDIEKINCEISIEREDEIEDLDKERPFDNYYAIKFKKADLDENVGIFKQKLKGENLYRTRDAGYEDGIQLSWFEIFSNKDIEEEINNILLSEKIESEKMLKF